MTAIYVDSPAGDDFRRQKLYDGGLFVYGPKPSAVKLCELARELIEEAFAPHHPPTAQEHYEVEEFARILADLKPRFIHHPRAKQLIQSLFVEVGCDPEKTHFDVPRMRTATSDGFLTSGIAYAFHPHRDIWYSAPPSQINWWIPIYEIEPGNAMAFHPHYWNKPIKNGSATYDYYEWNATSRKDAAKHVKTDTRVQPKPEEPIELDPQVVPVCDVGGILMFSAAHLHSTIPNATGKTRFSIDFRTVHIDDVIAKRGAPNPDAACTGTALRDFLRGSDLVRIPEEVASMYDAGSSRHGELVFQPQGAR